MSERKYSPKDIASILRVCNSGSMSCAGCKLDEDKCCDDVNIELQAADTIEELLAQLRWIPVGEKLPELIPCNAGDGHGYSEAVQICTNGKKVLTAIYSDAGWLFAEIFWQALDETVTHWRPVVGNLPWATEVQDEAD